MNDITTLSEIPVVERDGEPRALDLEIAERLGLSRPRDIRKLIERNLPELQRFGGCATVARPVSGNVVNEYWLNEEQALLVATLSQAPRAPEVRAMLIRTFVAWRRGHLPSELPAAALESLTRTNGICRMLIAKVTGMEKSIPEMAAKIAAELLPAMVTSALGAQNLMVRRGKTAGQIWQDHGFPKMKTTCWFGNRLAAMGCAIDGGGRGELGLTKARLFDPDKAEAWLRNGGRLMVETYITERQGQKVLRLVPKGAPADQPTA